MRSKIYDSPRSLKSVLFVFAIAIILLLLLYTQHLVNTLRNEARQILEFYASFYERAITEADDTELNFIFEEIIKRTDFPMIMTDEQGNPTGWKGIGIDPGDYSEEALKKVRSLVEAMAEEIDPIPLRYKDIPLGYLYYGDSKSIQQLRWLPYVEILVIGLYIMIGFFGINSIRRSEQQFIWIGMAKETAHQLGTPLSSLMGWIELLRHKTRGEEVRKIVDEIQQDVDRLNKVAQRFSRIGSRPELVPTELAPVVEDVISYFRRRLPQMGKRVDIHFEDRLRQPVRINPELFEWVLENLIKNALDAIGTERGEIRIIVDAALDKKYQAAIDVIDTGRGIQPQDRNNIFRPGFSTKKRGWGLGLSLSRRIIENYHKGKLILKHTAPGKGTTMRILI